MPEPCPSLDHLRAVLEGQLSLDEQTALTRHLDGCSTCQQTLERLASGSRSWQEVARQLRQAPRVEEPPSALQKACRLAQQEPSATSAQSPAESSNPAAGDFPFLEPPGVAGDLGRLGPYPILKLLGQGGMGLVFKGIDPTLERLVAIKVMAPQLAASETSRQRFLREARAAAAVRHGHVVAIHAVAETEGIPYLVMQFIAGRSLLDRLNRDGPLPPLEAARIGLQTAQGLAAAHAQGLVHRDIKPANILIEDRTGQVKITDFGLARAVDDVSLTQSGVIAGTPAFMSPEQARGDSVDHRTDLFSLGSVLYTLCTGQAPFRARQTMDLLRLVCEQTPLPVQEINPQVPDWLAGVIERLHARDPGQRFASAQEVADVLDSHLARLAETAQPAPRPRLRCGLMAAGVFLLFLLAGGVALFFAHPWTVTPPNPEPEVAIVPNNEQPTGREEGPPPPPTKVPKVEVREVPPTTGAPPPKPPVPIQPLIQLIRHSNLTSARGKIAGLVLAPDGKTLAVGQNDGVIQLWTEQARTWKPAATLKGHRGHVFTLAFSADGQSLASGGTDRTVRLWKKGVAGWGEAGILEGHSGDIYGLAFTPDGTTLFTGAGIPMAQMAKAKPGEVKHWNLERGEQLTLPRMPEISRAILSLSLAPDGQTLAFGSQHQMLGLWNPRTGAVLAELPDRCCLYGLAWSSDGKMLASGGCDAMAKVWSLDRGVWKRTPLSLRHLPVRRPGPVQTPTVRRLAFDREGKVLLSFVLEGEVRFWDLATGEVVAQLAGPATDRYEQAAFAPECHRVAAATAGGTIQVWDYVPNPNLGIPAFVVLARDGRPERRCHKLADAVTGAQSGDTVEVRGNGPFPMMPLNLGPKSLTIRAGQGFHPVLQRQPGSETLEAPLLNTLGSLILLGLELQSTKQSLITSSGASLVLAHCRLVQKGLGFGIHFSGSALELRNTEILCASWAPLTLARTGAQDVVLDNCILVGYEAVLPTDSTRPGVLPERDVRIQHSTLVSVNTGILNCRLFWPLQDQKEELQKRTRPPVRIHLEGNVLEVLGPTKKTQGVLAVTCSFDATRQKTEEILPLLPVFLAWVDRGNLHGESGSFLTLNTSKGPRFPSPEPLTTLTAWQRFWKLMPEGSIQGPVRFAAPSLASGKTPVDTMGPADFRLAENSSGKGAGPGGKDLGANVDQVGPGLPYERWQKTPEYQQRLERTRQLK